MTSVKWSRLQRQMDEATVWAKHGGPRPDLKPVWDKLPDGKLKAEVEILDRHDAEVWNRPVVLTVRIEYNNGNTSTQNFATVAEARKIVEG